MEPIHRRIDLMKLDTKEIIIWHSNDMRVWMQGMLWDGKERKTTFIPTKCLGFVAITARNVDAGCIPPNRGYVVFRPCALQFSYDITIRAKLMAVGAEKMQAWYDEYGPWEHYSLAPR